MHWINRGPFCVLLLLLLVADCCQPLTDFLIYIPIHRWLFLYSYFIRYIVYICVFVVWNVGIMSVMLLLCNEIVCNGWHGWPPDGFYTVERENIFEKVEKEKKTHTKTSHQSGVSSFWFTKMMYTSFLLHRFVSFNWRGTINCMKRDCNTWATNLCSFSFPICFYLIISTVVAANRNH